MSLCKNTIKMLDDQARRQRKSRAQSLYDWREKWQVCSGSDLHEFFFEETGTPAPKGNTSIDYTAASEFVATTVATARANNPSQQYYYEQALDGWFS